MALSVLSLHLGFSHLWEVIEVGPLPVVTWCVCGEGCTIKSHSTQVNVSIAECLPGSWLEAPGTSRRSVYNMAACFRRRSDEGKRERERAGEGEREGEEERQRREGRREAGIKGKAGEYPRSHSLIYPNLKKTVSSLLPFSAGHTDQI